MKNLTIWQLNNLSRVLTRLTLKNLKGNYDDNLQIRISQKSKMINQLVEDKFDLLTKEEQRRFIKEPLI